MFRGLKIALVGFLCVQSVKALAFSHLVCAGDLDVRLQPSGKKATSLPFSIKKKDALELELSYGGEAIGQLFPWEHVVWQPASSLPSFANLKFKTDDTTLIDLSVTTKKEQKSHTLHCEFRVD